MAQRTSRGSARRVPSAPVKKPFPWGFAAGIAVLALALAGILFYAVSNTGSGFRTAADRLDDSISGIEKAEGASANHVTGRVAYQVNPPNSGDHSPYPQTCQVYDQPIVPEHAVHSMEHGAAWVTYRPDLPADQVAVLRRLVEGDPYRMLSPYPGLSSAVSLQAWGRTLRVDTATDPRVEEFLEGYTNGPQTREKGAACSGVSQPGTEPFVQGPGGSFQPGGAAAPPAAPAPSASAPASTAPRPSPSASR